MTYHNTTSPAAVTFTIITQGVLRHDSEALDLRDVTKAEGNANVREEET